MKKTIRKIAHLFIPTPIRAIIWRSIPKFYKVNTYSLKNPKIIENLSPINKKFNIREVDKKDLMQLRKAESYRNAKKFDKKIPPRLNSDAWHGLAVFDNTTNEIAYIAWIIDKTIPYFEEFGIKMTKGQFLLKDGFCVPKYRHQGLHTRMEQERINYCLRNGAEDIFIQIHDSNKGGKKSVLYNGYKLYQQNYVIQWPIFNVFRSLNSFLRNPFRKIIK